MKVEDLIKILKDKNPKAFVVIETDSTTTDEIIGVRHYETDSSNVVVISSFKS